MANRYWVGGSGTWDASSTTHWSTSSGGSDGASVPTSSDNVIFDSLSYNNNYTVTLGANTNCFDMTWGNPSSGSPVFDGSTYNCSVYGSLYLVSGMTFTRVSNLDFKATDSRIITTNNVTIQFGDIRFNGAGSWTLQDNLTELRSANDGMVRLLSGTLNLNGFNLVTNSFYSSNTGVRVLNAGSGTIICNGDPSAVILWNIYDATDLTINPGTSTIKFTDASANDVTFVGGGLNYNIVWFARGTSANSNIITGSNTFGNLKDTGTVAHSLIFTHGTTQTISLFTVSGSAGQLISINSDTTATHTLVKSGLGNINCDYLEIQHSVATPVSTWYAGAHSTNNQATATAGSGWVFTVPPPLVTTMVTIVGSFVLTGINIMLRFKRFIGLLVGLFTLTGFNINITKPNYWKPKVVSSTNWKKQSKGQ